MAAAAAIAGLIRWVRPPGPAGPRNCGSRWRRSARPARACRRSCARHIEQPGSRHSKPASMKMLVETFLLGLLLHEAGARHDQRLTPRDLAALRDAGARARRSSMRPLVQEPMKTRCTGTSVSGVPAVRPIYSSVRSIGARCASSAIVGRVRHDAGDRQHVLRAGAPGDLRRDVGGVERHVRVVMRAGIGGQRPPVGDAPAPRPRPSAPSGGP